MTGVKNLGLYLSAQEVKMAERGERVPGKVVFVSDIPPCFFCEQDGVVEPGCFDFATRMGPWGNGCERHFLEFCAQRRLGTGLGQILAVK